MGIENKETVRFSPGRIASTQRQLSHEEAFDRWRQSVVFALQELSEAINAPLETSVTEFIPLKKGDPGYDEAPFEVTIEHNSFVFETKKDSDENTDC